MGFFVAVTLYVKPGKESEFRRYEAGAFKRIAGHSGRIVHVLRCAPEARGLASPYEMHLLEFPSQITFESFVSDGAPFEDERDTIIEKSIVVTGWSVPADQI